MDKARVFIHLYKVNASEGTNRTLESLINVIDQDDLEDRIRGVGAAEVRLDHIDKKKADGNRLWFLDFTRIRDTHGPGKTSRVKPVEDIPMEEDEFFGEEAAALYLPDRRYLLVQYNHFGVRPQAMQTYLSNYLDNEVNIYTFNIVLDPTAENTFRRQTLIKKFEIGVDLTKLTAANRRAGNTLREMADAAAHMDGARMKIQVSVGMDRQGRLAGGVKHVIESFMRNNDAVLTAIVTGRETPTSDIEVVDLVEQKLVHADLITPTDGRRLAQVDRYRTLMRAYTKWKPRIEG